MRPLIITLFFLLSCGDSPESVNNSSESPSAVQKIVGKWLVTGSNILPFDHISFCKNLSLNAVFEFNENGSLKVLDSKTGAYCNLEIPQNYSVNTNVLKMVEDDMLFEYKIQKLTPDTLILGIDRVPQHYYTDSIQNEIEMERDLREISSNGINVILVRMKEGH